MRCSQGDPGETLLTLSAGTVEKFAFIAATNSRVNAFTVYILVISLVVDHTFLLLSVVTIDQIDTIQKLNAFAAVC